MYYSDLRASLVGTDTNICAMLEMDSIEPIAKCLSVVGGYVLLNSMRINNEDIYNIRYYSLDNRISIVVQLDKTEYLHNLDFLGHSWNQYQEPIEFIANGNKLKLP